MAVLVIGATSQIGYFVLQRLAAAGISAVALSRQMQQPSATVQWVQGGLPLSPIKNSNYEAIVSFGPLASLASWLGNLQQAPAPVVVATSSMSAVTKIASVVDEEVALARSLRDGEAALSRECDRLGIRWTILRPTLIYGAGLDKSLTPLARRAMRWRFFPLPAGDGLRQPVHADDVAHAALRALEVEAASSVTLEIGGGERLTAAQMFQRVRESLVQKTVAIPVGKGIQALMRGVIPAARGPLSRLQVDLIADNDALTRFLSISPRPFRPVASMWQPPTIDRKAA